MTSFSHGSVENQKSHPVRRWLFDIFKFPKVEVGELEQVELIMKTSTPKI